MKIKNTLDWATIGVKAIFAVGGIIKLIHDEFKEKDNNTAKSNKRKLPKKKTTTPKYNNTVSKHTGTTSYTQSTVPGIFLLGRLSSELNVGMTTLVEVLTKHGWSGLIPESSQKITSEQYSYLKRMFAETGDNAKIKSIKTDTSENKRLPREYTAQEIQMMEEFVNKPWVPDTNVLIENPHFINYVMETFNRVNIVLDNKIFQQGTTPVSHNDGTKIVLPRIVAEELDDQKRKPELAENVRKIQRTLNERQGDVSFVIDSTPFFEKGKRIPHLLPMDYTLKKHDNRVLYVAMKHKDSVLITNDMELQRKAKELKQEYKTLVDASTMLHEIDLLVK